MAFFLRGNYFIQFYLVYDERSCRMISLFCDDIVNWVYLFLITWIWLNLPHFFLIISLYQCSCQVFRLLLSLFCWYSPGKELSFPKPAICRRWSIWLYFWYLPSLPNVLFPDPHRLDFTSLLGVSLKNASAAGSPYVPCFNPLHSAFLITSPQCKFRYLFKAHCYLNAFQEENWSITV